MVVILLWVFFRERRTSRVSAGGGIVSADSTAAGTSKAVSSRDILSSACGDRVIREGRVGKLAIGDPVDSVRRCAVVRDTMVSYGEGSLTRTLFVAFAADTVGAEIVDGKVWRLTVSSPGLRTVDSLGVGTSLRQLLDMSSPRGASGEGRMFVLSPDHCGQSFEINYFGPMPRGGWIPAALARLPDTTHVIRVLVNSCHRSLY